MKKTRQLIILDRDGVINHDSDAYIKSPQEWHAIAGSLHAIALLNKAGYFVAIASNQSGLARGYFTQQQLDAIHLKMQTELALVGGHVDAIFYCPHGPEDACLCRKPKPGLLFQIARHFNLDLSQALLIGDSASDREAADAASCEAVLVKTGKPILSLTGAQENNRVFDCLLDVVEYLLDQKACE